jgi:hypothetical protein
MKRLMLLCASLLVVACGSGQESPPDGGTPAPPPRPPVTLNIFGEFDPDPSPSTVSLPGWYPVGRCNWVDGVGKTEGYAGTPGMYIWGPDCAVDSVRAAIPAGMTHANFSSYLDIWGRSCPGECVVVSLRWYASTVLIQESAFGLPYNPGWNRFAVEDVPIPKNATHVQVRYSVKGEAADVDRAVLVVHDAPK